MDEEFRLPDPLHVAAMERVCPTTREAWMWCCEECDVHGTADTEDEANRMAALHQECQDELSFDAGEPTATCEVIVWRRTAHERTKD